MHYYITCVGCYGVTESGSVSSTASTSSTEPWFCEPCQGNVVNPPCQLCPNLGYCLYSTFILFIKTYE